MQSNDTFDFRVHPERLAILRLDPQDDVPAWARGDFVCVTRTRDELSIVCPEDAVPRHVQGVRNRVALGIEGVIPMTTIGLLADLCAALAAVKVPVFAISTHDTDWLLVPGEHVDAACAALRERGHRVAD